MGAVDADDPAQDAAKPPPGDCQCADSSTLEAGSDYAGNDIQGERHAASVQECCELCLATPGCTCAHHCTAYLNLSAEFALRLTRESA